MLHYKPIFIGNQCNNNCITCQFINQQRTQLDKSKIIEEISSIKNPENIVFWGGEPTLREDLLAIIKAVKDRGFKRIKVNTNGRIFSDMNAVRTGIENSIFFYDIKIFGSNPEQHDSQTRTMGSFNQTLQGISNLKKSVIPNTNKHPFVQVRIKITNSNLNNLINIVLILLPLYVDRIILDYSDYNLPIDDLEVPIDNAIKTGIFSKIWIETENIPACYMNGMEEHVSELRNQPLNLHQQVTECSRCNLNQVCPGVNKSLSKISNFEVKPVKDNQLKKIINECDHLCQ